ncbi:MAG TPA: hypothetical protein PKI01_05870 [Bacteroidales bacterium]|nr:hypothetical protein [Bacteroidales bacterium]
MKNFRLSFLLIGLYFIGWFLLVFIMYSFFHPESRATTEVICFYESLYLSSVIYMILIPLISVVLSIIYRVKNNPGKHWNYLFFAMFCSLTLVVGILFDFISVGIYKMVYFFEWGL